VAVCPLCLDVRRQPSIGPSRSAKAVMVRRHCDRAGPNAMRIVSSRSNRMPRGNFM
jgi:hypothetical protein